MVGHLVSVVRCLLQRALAAGPETNCKITSRRGYSSSLGQTNMVLGRTSPYFALTQKYCIASDIIRHSEAGA